MPADLQLPTFSPRRRILACSEKGRLPALPADDISKSGFELCMADSVDEAGEQLAAGGFDVCVIDDADGGPLVQQLAAQIRSSGSVTQILCLVSENSAWGTQTLPAVSCDVLEKPYSPTAFGSLLLSAVERAHLLTENRRLRQQLHSRTLRDMVGHSPAMQALRERVNAAAASGKGVLIAGEPGSGTKITAQAVHSDGPSAQRPFVRVDCCVHTAESLERELFGDDTRRRSFSGTECTGRIDLALGGTLFLDDVDAVALQVQKSLATLLEANRLRADAPGEASHTSVRVIAATHADLAEKVRRGLFRDDLFRCLNEIHIQTPPLRDRRSDISLLTEHFLNRCMVEEGRPTKRLSVQALDLLEAHDWPGNVRELRTVVERTCLLNLETHITADMIRPWLSSAPVSGNGDVPGTTLREMERKLIEATFARCEGNREQTANALQIGLRTLSGKLRAYGYPPRGGPGSNLQTTEQKKAA